MILIKDIPQVPLRTALFKLLKDCQTHDVHGDVPERAALPYITLGAMSFKPLGNKTTVIWQATASIEVWADGNQKREMNDILNDICVLLSYYGTELEIEGYKVIDVNLDLIEAYPETTAGYHGTVTVVFNLQKGKVQQ
jgi:hypothetical protein